MRDKNAPVDLTPESALPTLSSVNLKLAKQPLKFNSSLANFVIKILVKQTPGYI